MASITEDLLAIKNSLCKEVSVGSLISRNKIAHKWKAPWRSLLLREAVSWRVHNLLEQSITLHACSGMLGARILLRSAFETLAVLIYLNQSMRNVVSETLDFHEFSEATSKLLLGSRDSSTSYSAINILTVLQKADKKYNGIMEWYNTLSESAHPNYEGMILGYSKSDSSNHITTFENNWTQIYGESHPMAIKACLDVFEHEYNNEWADAFEEIEQWICLNDEHLELTKVNKSK